MIYNKQDHQVTIYATITPATPDTLAAIIATSEPPRSSHRHPTRQDWAIPHNTPERNGCATHDSQRSQRLGVSSG